MKLIEIRWTIFNYAVEKLFYTQGYKVSLSRGPTLSKSSLFVEPRLIKLNRWF